MTAKVAWGVVLLGAVLLGSGCGVDKNAAKYDQLRYDELQEARCDEMASFLSAPMITDDPEDYDTALKRCEDMKSLTLEEYKRLANHGRETGSWDIYEVYPEKQ
ncbi:hypothetical protein ACFL2V_12570 [Pseudomonadota bacterium]